jgi:peptidylprolyl isomerase
MKRPLYSILLVALVTLAAVLLASCGGDDDESTGDGSGSPGATTPGGTPLVTIPPVPSPINPADCPPATGTAPTPDVNKTYSAAPGMTIDPEKNYTAVVKTVRGDITLQLLPKVAPEHVNSFVFLAREGFFDGVTFHRVIDGFVAQAGDPTGSGTGGPGYTLRLEPSDIPFERGVVGAARKGNDLDSAGSQWFITFGNASQLNGSYTVFAFVVDGMDVADCLTVRDPSSTIPGDAIITVEIREE